ncbi:MAG: hypothetical protein WKG06_41020 [Segetibacter sp.]
MVQSISFKINFTKISRRSKNLFVDLVNEKDNVISHLVLNNNRQQLTGKMVLNDSVPTGYYWLKAYTKHMAEKDSDKIYVQSIYILNAHTAGNSLLSQDAVGNQKWG